MAIISTVFLLLSRHKIFLAAVLTGIAATVHPLFAILLPLLVLNLFFKEHTKLSTILIFIVSVLAGAGSVINQYIWPKLEFIPRLQVSLAEKTGINLIIEQLRTRTLEATLADFFVLFSFLLMLLLAVFIFRTKEDFIYQKDSFIFKTWIVLCSLSILFVAQIENTTDLARHFSLLSSCSILILHKQFSGKAFLLLLVSLVSASTIL